MNKLIVANLKMNLELSDILRYKNELEKFNVKDVVISPSNIYLYIMKSS